MICEVQVNKATQNANITPASVGRCGRGVGHLIADPGRQTIAAVAERVYARVYDPLDVFFLAVHSLRSLREADVGGIYSI